MQKRKNKMKSIKSIVILFLFLNFGSLFAQGKYFVSSYLQFVSGRFENGTKYSNLYLYNGIKYQARDFYLSLNIPFVVVNTNTQSQPVRQNQTNLNASESQQTGDLKESHFGIGDLYLNFSYEIISERGVYPAISFDGYVKVPTATKTLGIGSGAFDYFTAIGLSKKFENLVFFTQLGYVTLGKVTGTNSSNPFTLSMGAGYLFNFQSVYFGYDSYSTIIQGKAPPSLFSLGYGYYVSSGLMLNAMISFPANKETSDLFLSGGINYKL